MNKKRLFFLNSAAFLCIIAAADFAAAKEVTVKVAESDIQSGYITSKINLEHYAKPMVKIEGVTYTSAVIKREDGIPSSPQQFDIMLGMDRKKAFAVVRIPAYSYATDGSIQRIETITYDYEEQPAEQKNEARVAAKGTTQPVSPLASGTWYKLAVSATGMYKIDYNYLSSQLGVSGIRSSQIRLFGHGGKMLPERNRVGEVKGLEENAIWVNDGGDGSFDPGDYFVFFAQGPLNWVPSSDNKQLIQEHNFYADKGYYLLNFDGIAEKRITTQPQAPVATLTTSEYSTAVLHEMELVNPQRFGKSWWGDEFSNAPGKQKSQSINMEVGDFVGTAQLKMQMVNTAATGAVFSASMNGQHMGTVSMSGTAISEYAKAFGNSIEWQTASLPATSTVKIDYTTSATDGSGWLDYIRINMRRRLSLNGNSLMFCDLNTVGTGNVAGYDVANTNGNTQVWDVTDPVNPVVMRGTLNGSTYTFSQNADNVHWFVAMNNSDFSAPEYVGTVANQNLFGSGQVDYIIVTHPDFKSAAERLAEFHRQRRGMKVLVATTTQVYNEFSSGGQDISAIRDFARMFYDRAGMDEAAMPKYLLLMGDASYDYKDRIKDNTNFVPTFEAKESFDFLSTYSNDDFFGFLDEGEDIERYDIVNALDIGVGRMPVKNMAEADAVVNKVIHYKSPATLGAWRLSTLYAADDNDGAGDHLEDAELMNSIVNANSRIHNASKVYLNAVPFISTPGGQRAPEANKSINDNIFKGAFLFNYNGHGNTTVLAHERILSKDDYNKWRNLDKMPFMVTATCDFGQFDQPSFVSAGEEIMLKANGGVIATLTTTHLVYAYANNMLNSEFLAAQFQHVNGKWNTFGDAMRIGKNSTYANAKTTSDVILNFRKFVLLGDPALEPNFPEFFIHTTSVKDGATGQVTNKIGALGEYVISGEVTDVDGNLKSDFSGTLAVTIFDKPRRIRTINGASKTFEVQNNTIYKGKATVTNGAFSFSFIAPKDINYEEGKGTISYYADNGQTDAAGRDTSVIVGGASDNPRSENNPPVVTAFIKDSLFRSGGLTGSNTAIFAILEDETGINVSGNAVGHDLTAVLDYDESKPYIMNDYYETAPNTFKRGFVYFPVEGIPEGRHRFTVKAWDVNNNSGEGHIDFEVADGKMVKVQNLMNYPNPFRDVTNFVFEHNHPDADLTAEINIYNPAGVHVRNLKQNFITEGSKSHEVKWDGTDNNGAKLPSGVYIYRMMIKTSQGIHTTAYQKLVIVR